jgi:hypothetical protein
MIRKAVERNIASAPRVENITVDTMPHCHVHRPPIESPKHRRHTTIEKVSMTPHMLASHGKFMPQSTDTNLTFDRTGMTEEGALYRHTDSKVNNIISRALNRKHVSYAFHTGYP